MNSIIVGLVGIVLAVVIAILLVLKGGDMWKWICCFRKKDENEKNGEGSQIENNFEREDREALEKYNRALEEYKRDRDEYNEALKEYTNGMKEDLKELKKTFNKGFDKFDEGLHSMQNVYNAGLDEIKLLLESRPAELNDEQKNQIDNN
jgi:hypothetical protein